MGLNRLCLRRNELNVHVEADPFNDAGQLDSLAQALLESGHGEYMLTALGEPAGRP